MVVSFVAQKLFRDLALRRNCGRGYDLRPLMIANYGPKRMKKTKRGEEEVVAVDLMMNEERGVRVQCGQKRPTSNRDLASARELNVRFAQGWILSTLSRTRCLEHDFEISGTFQDANSELSPLVCILAGHLLIYLLQYPHKSESGQM